MYHTQLSGGDVGPGATVLTLALSLGLLAATPPVRPIEVERTAGTDGTLAVTPPFIDVTVAPGGSAEVAIDVVNGAAHAVDLVIEASGVDVDASGAPHPGEGGDARRWVALPTATLHLEAGETAHVWPVVSVPVSTAVAGYAFAVVARQPSATTGAATIVLVDVSPHSGPGGIGVAVDLAPTGVAGMRATATVTSTGSGQIVSGHMAVRSWLGTTVALIDIEPTAVLDRVPRIIAVDLPRPLVPGPYRNELSMSAFASTSAWLVHPAVAALVLLVPLLLLARARLVRARHRRQP